MLIRVDIDERVRLIGAAMLLTSFRDENAACRPHPLRSVVLDYLAAFQDHPCVKTSRELATRHWMSAFYCYAVLLNQNPEKLARCPDTLPMGYDAGFIEDFDVAGYPGLLSDLYRDAELTRLWDQTAESWRQVIEECTQVLARSHLQDMLEVLFGDVQMEAVCIPNPLDPPQFGFGPNDGVTAYAIFGPRGVARTSTEEVSFAWDSNDLALRVFHELAHTLWGGARANVVELSQSKLAGRKIAVSRRFAQLYPTWQLQLDELFIRVASVLYRKELEGDAAVQMELAKESRDIDGQLLRWMYEGLNCYVGLRKTGRWPNLAHYVMAILEEFGKRGTVA